MRPLCLYQAIPHLKILARFFVILSAAKESECAKMIRKRTFYGK
jgi:hypothetical protein